MDNPDLSRLKNVDIFAELTDDELAKVASWLEIEEYGGDRPLLLANDSGYAFFILDDGRAHAEIDGQVMEILRPGSVFGEIAFFAPDGHRTATIVAETPLRVFAMFGTRFRTMQAELPKVADRLEQLAKTRLARTQPAE